MHELPGLCAVDVAQVYRRADGAESACTPVSKSIGSSRDAETWQERHRRRRAASGEKGELHFTRGRKNNAFDGGLGVWVQLSGFLPCFCSKPHSDCEYGADFWHDRSRQNIRLHRLYGLG